MRSRKGLGLELTLFGLAALCLGWSTLGLSSVPKGFDPAQRAPQVLRVVTWNLGTGVDAGTTALRNEDLEAVAQALKQLDPELAFLQELTGKHQIRALADALGEGWSWQLQRLSGGRCLAVLARRGVLEERDAEFLERAQSVLYVSDSGLRLSCVALHASAFSSSERNRSIGMAADYLRRSEPGELQLLVGDLNLDLGIDKRRDLFTDDEYKDVETYNFLAQRMLDVGQGLGPTAKPDRRIDYIFVVPEELEVLQAGPWPGQRTPGMDHHPMVADLRPLR